MSGDTRPIMSPMPAEAAAIGQALVDQLKPMLDSAVARVAALPGDAAERSSDALSTVSNVAAFVVLQLTAHLMLRYSIEPYVAVDIALTDVRERVTHELAGVMAGSGRA